MAYTSSAYLRICFLLATFCWMEISTKRSSKRPKTLKTCGISTIQQDRIVGGRPADHGEYPWMAALEIYDEFFNCGATILNEHWVVTAAHCFEHSKYPDDYAIYVGSHMKIDKSKVYRPVRYEVSKLIVHRKFDDRLFYNDIALIRTKYPININGSNGLVNAICLPRKGEEPTGWAIVTGWGRTEYKGQTTDVLHEAKVSIVNKKACIRKYKRKLRKAKGMICARSVGKDSCEGDSGGPLMQQNASGQFTLIGIVSFGRWCGLESYPGVYTKVSSYIDWIDFHISRHE